MDTGAQTVINWLGAALGTLAGAVGLLYRSKVDTLEKERVNYVTHDDLEKHLDKIAEERRQIATAQFNWHVENSRRLERIEDGVNKGLDRIHERIDDMAVIAAAAARKPR